MGGFREAHASTFCAFCIFSHLRSMYSMLEPLDAVGRCILQGPAVPAEYRTIFAAHSRAHWLRSQGWKRGHLSVRFLTDSAETNLEAQDRVFAFCFLSCNLPVCVYSGSAKASIFAHDDGSCGGSLCPQRSHDAKQLARVSWSSSQEPVFVHLWRK